MSAQEILPTRRLTWRYAAHIPYPDGTEVRYFYNAAGLLETVHSPCGETRYVYDGMGRVTERILPDKTKTIYWHDQLGRIARIVHSNEHGHLLDEFEYAYDPAGNISRGDISTTMQNET